MSSRPSREMLEAMKRPDLQKLCKDFGLRANLKSEELIEMILKAPDPATSEVPAAPQPRATSVAATRKDGTRFRERSTGSMIVHDDSGDEAISPAEDPHGASEPDPTAGRSTRTRKGKDTQSRSGVGRPAAGGVSGGRVSTRAKSRRGKARSFPTTAVPIPEEPEPGREDPPLRESDRNVAACSPTHRDKPIAVSPPPDPGPSNVRERTDIQVTNADSGPDVPVHPRATTTSSVTYEGLHEYVANLIRPFEERIQSQASDVERLTAQVAGTEELQRTIQSMTAELQALRVQVTNVDARVASMDTRITDMDTRVADMDTRMSSIQDRMDATDAVYNQLPSTPKYSTPIVSQSIARHVVISPMDEDDDPGVSPSSLGKRPRTSPPGDESRRDDLSEEGAPGSPDKKRIRLEYPEGFVGRTLDFEAERLRRPSAEPRASDGGLSAPFPVYTGPSVGNVGAAPGPSSQRLTTASAGELENQLPISHNYDFSFTSAAWDPVASTPYVARFPRPEAPTSPSPVMPPSSSSYGHVIERHGRRERHDYFHPMGTPGRPRLRASDAGTSAMASGFVNPASLMRSPSPPPERRTTSNDVGASLGLVRPTNPDTPAPPVRRTMYGTELDNDSRFGDFGVEGVAAGFWNPAKYNPTSEDFE